MELDAVRAVVAVADTGQFQDAGIELSITQQAVSKRVATLERRLGARLFTRTPRGARPTVEGLAFLPHARELLRVAERAEAAVRPGRRALRVDVIGRHLAPAALLRDFHRASPATDLDVVTLDHADAAIAAVADGTVDAAFRTVTVPAHQLPEGVVAVPVLDEPLELLTGPHHPLATADAVGPSALAEHRIWMPGLVAGTEWTLYYEALATAFGLTIDPVGPNFGVEPLLDAVARSPQIATIVGERTRLLWPADHDLRRLALRDPVPVYPHALVHRRDNTHPALAELRAHLRYRPLDVTTWTPSWALR